MRKSLPLKPEPGAGLTELHETMAELLEWATAERLAELKAAGFADIDLFNMRRVANSYRSGIFGPSDYQLLQGLLAKMGDVKI